MLLLECGLEPNHRSLNRENLAKKVRNSGKFLGPILGQTIRPENYLKKYTFIGLPKTWKIP